MLDGVSENLQNWTDTVTQASELEWRKPRRSCCTVLWWMTLK